MVLHAKLAEQSYEEMRTVQRRTVHCRAFVRDGGVNVVPVELTNVSTDGCRFRSAEAFETATLVWLKIAGFGARQARIIWAEGDHYGCEFVAPVQTKTVDDLLTATRAS